MDINLDSPLAIIDSKKYSVRMFLNRILGLATKKQNSIFECFYDILSEIIKQSKLEGTYENGISYVAGKNLTISSENTVHTTPEGDHIEHVVISSDKGISWDEIIDIKQQTEEIFMEQQCQLRKILIDRGEVTEENKVRKS